MEVVVDLTCDVHYDLSKYPYLRNIQINRRLRSENYPIAPNDLISRFKAVLLDEKQSLQANGRSNRQIFGILFNRVFDIDGNNISLSILNDRKLTNEIFS